VRLERLVGMSFGAPLFTLGERVYSLVDLVTLTALLVAVWTGSASSLARSGRTCCEPRAPTRRAGGGDDRRALRALAAGTIVLLQAWGST